MSEPRSPALTQGIKPIPRRQVSSEVARQIQHLIASRNLKEGDRLPTERDLAAALEVGRGAVREGLKYLAGLEIIDIRQGSGIYVRRAQHLALIDSTSLASEDRRRLLRDATAARRVLDCAAIEVAVRQASDDDIAALRAYLIKADSDPERTKLAHRIDLTFEAMLGRMSGNAYIVALQEEAHRYFRTAWEAVGLIPRPAAERSDQHWDILRAIEERDEAKARRLMEQHFEMHALDGTDSD